MQLDQIVIETRARHGWSAIDLGFRFIKKHYFAALALWLIVASPFLVMAYFQPFAFWVSYLFIWWFKPLMERPILFLLSRELFNQSLSIVDVIKQAKQWLNPGWFPDISYRRISFSRSFYMPLTVLENLSGSAYSKRIDALNASTSSSHPGWLTVTLYHIEQIFYFAILLLIELVLSNRFDLMESLTDDSSLLALFIMLITFALIAPFYVASGFMLYISRRIELEGWDIELKFRNWIEKEHV